MQNYTETNKPPKLEYLPSGTEVLARLSSVSDEWTKCEWCGVHEATYNPHAMVSVGEVMQLAWEVKLPDGTPLEFENPVLDYE
jgi:hypothetical protein